MAPKPYRGRLAPSPTGWLHLGHARTFWIAQQRCRLHQGILILRNEDLDRDRCRQEFEHGMIENLRWFGLDWQEGPDIGGPCAPYSQSQRRYDGAFEALRAAGLVYPCRCSRKDILTALGAPHVGEEEPVYPGTCRPPYNPESPAHATEPSAQHQRMGASKLKAELQQERVSWRFRVPDGEVIRFDDACQGPQQFIAGVDFGDFVVWRHDGLPSYHLAVVQDDVAMGVTEVVRGADLLLSTARQLLLLRALGLPRPTYYHAPLVTDAHGLRLAKRHDALSLRNLRATGATPERLRAGWVS